MTILTTSGWSDYTLIDSGNGRKLERFGKYILVRPDPQIIWQPRLSKNEWDTADATFERIREDKGRWVFKKEIPTSWEMSWNELTFLVKLSPFKHTGVFPEQMLQWQWMQEKITQANRPTNILNIFAYTGLASLALASAGARVTHVDASRPAISWARENQLASNLQDKPIRWILDDALKFCEREIKRGNKYDGIIMDPPVYGHGPTGQIWKFNEHFPILLSMCSKLLSNHALFVVVNAYAITASSLMLENVLQDRLPIQQSNIDVGELALQESSSGRLLSTGLFARWWSDQ